MAKVYAVKECFNTVQGEGARAGARSVFLRLAGCNAWNGTPEDRAIGKGACALWCDTDFVGGERLTADQIVERLERAWPIRHGDEQRWVVVTGGEPLLQLDSELVQAIHSAEFCIAVETNGSIDNPIMSAVDWLTVSPKRGLPVKDRALKFADELKVVLPGVHMGSGDAGWTAAELEGMRAQATGRARFYVQPQDPIDPGFVEVSHLHGNLVAGRDQPHSGAVYQARVKACLEFVDAHPAWRISLQTHKLLGVR